MPDQSYFEQNYPQAKFDPEDDHWIDKNDNVEFRYYGTVLDEIVADNVHIHFECMDTGSWWMSITTPGGKDYDVNLGVKRIKSAGDRRDEIWTDKHLENWAFHEDR